MSPDSVLIDRADVSASLFATLDASVRRHATLADVIAWGVAQIPPCIVADVVVQDEFTHDVILPFRDGEYVLVYDTT